MSLQSLVGTTSQLHQMSGLRVHNRWSGSASLQTSGTTTASGFRGMKRYQAMLQTACQLPFLPI